jgi:signal peptidase I
MLRLFKVSENSLSPIYQEGDFVVTVKIPFFFSPQPGDIVVFNQPGYGTMIKLVQRVSPQAGEFYVVGTQPESVDSRQFGLVKKKNLLGKVVWHIKKQP